MPRSVSSSFSTPSTLAFGWHSRESQLAFSFKRGRSKEPNLPILSYTRVIDNQGRLRNPVVFPVPFSSRNQVPGTTSKSIC